MAYYLAGDYYLANAGDPGLFSFLGKAVKGVVGAASGFLSGGPLGAIRGGLRGFTASRAAVARQPLVQAPVGVAPMSFGQRMTTAVQAIVPGGVEPGAGCPPGFHLDKQTQSKCVKNRRMNPGNARALRRAIRREASFVGLAKRTLRGSGYTFKRTGVARKRRRS